MLKLPGKVTAAQVSGVVGFWKSIQSLSVSDIAQEADRPFRLALVGDTEHTALLAARLALETPVPKDSPQGPPDVRPFLTFHLSAADAPPGAIVLEADPLTADETRLAEALTQIAQNHKDVRLALARRIPAFRPAVCAQLIQEESAHNAKIAVLSALPGVIPFTDALLPATAIGDMILLTKNQAMLLLKIAAAYGKEVDLRARGAELLPVVGSAFGWRAVARELIGLVPGGVGVAIKGAVAYAGTFTVGKAAAVFYSTGQTTTTAGLRKIYKDALKDAGTRVQQWRRRKDTPALPPPALETTTSETILPEA